METMTVKINKDLWKKLKLEAVEKETTIQELASKYINEGLKKEEGK
jgi:hypothetical protein